MIVRFFGMCMEVERKCNKSCGLDVKCLHNLMFEHLVVDGGTVWEDYGAWLEEVCHGGGGAFRFWRLAPLPVPTLFPDCQAAPHSSRHALQATTELKSALSPLSRFCPAILSQK